MDYVQTDLKNVLKDSSNLEFDMNHVTIILYNMLCCMKFIHSAGIMHRDIKTATILLDDNCNTKICDFGLARQRAPQPYDDMYQFVRKRMNISPQHEHYYNNAPITPKGFAQNT